jgi:hypothetical protein
VVSEAAEMLLKRLNARLGRTGNAAAE